MQQDTQMNIGNSRCVLQRNTMRVIDASHAQNIDAGTT